MPLYALVIPWFRRIVFPEVNRAIVDYCFTEYYISIIGIHPFMMMNYLVNLGGSALRATEGVLYFMYHLLTL